MSEVDDLINSYMRLNQAGRDRLASMAELMYKRFPLERKPSLTLVQDGHNVKPLDSVVHSRVNQRAIIGTSKAIHRK